MREMEWMEEFEREKLKGERHEEMRI